MDQEISMKCNSCMKGYNGTNGNGYQPCSCPPNNKKQTRQQILFKIILGVLPK